MSSQTPLPPPPADHEMLCLAVTPLSPHVQVQLVLLGSGRDDLEGDLRAMEAKRPDQCKAWVGFSVKIAHRINAGCDILLMPSR